MAEKIIRQLEDNNKNTSQNMARKPDLDVDPQKWSGILMFVVVFIVAIVLGRFAAKLTVRNQSDLPNVTYTQESGSANSYGQKNLKLCPDKAEGTVKAGGIDGEGTHHLVRKGGKDQYVYLTSSTVDLSLVENKKVAVWGKTYAAKIAGWLMDICYLEVK